MLRTQPARLRVAVAFVCALALFGGASRADEPQQLTIRLAAILAMVVTLWPLDFAPLRRRPALIWAAGVLVLLPLAQLIPLPADIWATLPGHEPYAEIARMTGTTQWRPSSLAPDLTLNALLALLPALAMVMASLFVDHGGRHVIVATLIGAAYVSALLGLLQLAAGGDAFHLYRVTSEEAPVGLMANRNHQAAFLACALPLAAAYAGHCLRTGHRARLVLALLLGCSTLLLVGLLLTGSRMGLVLGFVGAASAIMCWRRTGFPLFRQRGTNRLVVSGVAVSALLAMAFAVMRGGVIERLSATDFVDESRAASFRPMLETAQAFLPFGAGFGSFDAVYRRFEPDELLSTIYLNQAHSEPMQLAIEGGVPALILLALFLIWWVRTAGRAVLSGRGSGGSGDLAVACVASSAVLMLASLVDYPLRTPLLSSLFALSCVELARVRVRQPADRPGQRETVNFDHG